MDAEVFVDNAHSLLPDHETVVSSAPWPLIPPVHLPVELLSEIFIELSEAQVDQFENKSEIRHIPHLMTITAGSVCRRWRAVTRGTTSFWTFQRSSGSVAKDTRHVAAYIDACTTSSGHQELHLFCGSEEFLSIFFSRLLPHSARWASLNIHGGKAVDMAMLSTGQHCFGALKVIHLCYVNMPQGTWDFLASAPRLEEFRVYESSANNESAIIPPMSNLRTVENHIFDIYHLSTIFDAVAHSRETLESLCIAFLSSPSDLEIGTPVVMPALKQLDLDHACQVFMKSIVAPNLEELMNGYPDFELSAPELVFAMISHPQADPHSLRCLELNSLYILDENDSQTLLRCLARMINLEVLHLSYHSDQDEAPHLTGLSLAKHHGVPPILPCLRRLHFSLEPFLSDEELARQRRLLVDVVRSRMAPQILGGHAFAALRSFASGMEYPELGPKFKRWQTFEHTYLGE
ncbi:hypothetical protein GGG16DRAFT_64437 [Schizophyllum commune]